MDQTFGKKEKLKSKILIDRLFAEGRSMHSYPIKLIYISIPQTEPGNNKTAVSVPRRNFKTAVDRIYLKRLMREAYRKNKYLVNSDLKSSYALMFIYIGKEKRSYNQLFSATEDLLKKLSERIKSEES